MVNPGIKFEMTEIPKNAIHTVNEQIWNWLMMKHMSTDYLHLHLWSAQGLNLLQF